MEHLALLVPLLAGAAFLLFVFTWLRVRMLAAQDKRWAASTGEAYFSHFGEAVVGRMHVKSPFSHLTATPSTLRLVFTWKRYEFPRESIKRLGFWNPLWGGLVIQHSNPTYPSRVVFVQKNRNKVRSELLSLGYAYEAEYLRDEQP